ncbi:pleckstrin homology domain-containing family G member 7 [Tenrec ecaudatus]|uniref:pleckstrin homology domain-containing family G member 7 n=1 Tax=Tenrec ecaudatus TaxID=94439 RepID=UPI003F5A1AE7
MQHPAGDSPLETDREVPGDEGHSNEEPEHLQSTSESSNLDSVLQKHLVAVPLGSTGNMGSLHAEVQSEGNGAFLHRHCENQGNLLQFDRQAPGRISTSPTLRRLRGSGCGSLTSMLQQDTWEVSPWGSCKEPVRSTCYLAKKPPGSRKDSSPSISPLTFSNLRLSSDPEQAHPTADSVELQMRKQTPPQRRPINEGPLHQASPLPSPAPPCSSSQGEELHQSRLYEHRRSSVVLNLPGLEVFPGDLLVSDGAADYLCHPLLLLNSESKKSRWPFSKRGMAKDKHKHIADLEHCLSAVKITDFRGYEFHGLKDKTWDEVVETHQKLSPDQRDLRKQQEAMWELFTSECTYFLDHLLVLKMIFMNTLKYLQTHEYLLDVDLWRLFANLEELSQTSFGFVNSLFGTMKEEGDTAEPALSMDFISVLTKYFRGSLCQSHQTYCLNYTAAVFYLESLRQRDDFGIYLKWCEQNEQCRRLRLPELLVAPLHRLTRYPLLLKNIWKRSIDSTEKILIYTIKEKVEMSIRDLEGKVKWLDNFQKLRHLQEIIVWPPLWDRDKRFFIPECLKHIFKEHMAENILSPTSRHLLYEGKLTLAESTRFLDVYLFLFDDFLLVTKTKRNKKKLGGLDPGLMCPSLTPELQTVIKEGGSCTVLDQPIPLDRLVLKNIDPLHVSAFGLRNAFLIQHENRYRQCIAAFLLQAQTENSKKTWMAQMTAAISSFLKSQESKKSTLFSSPPAESSEI